MSSSSNSSLSGLSIQEFVARVTQMAGGGQPQAIYCSPEEYRRLTGLDVRGKGLQAAVVIGDRSPMKRVNNGGVVIRPRSGDPFSTITTLITLSEEERRVIDECVRESTLPDMFVKEMQLIDFLLLQYFTKYPRSKNKQEVLGLVKQIAFILKDFFVSYLNENAREIFSTKDDYTPIAEELYPKYQDLERVLAREKKTPPPICQVFQDFVARIVNFKYNDFVINPLFAKVSDLFPDIPSHPLIETIPALIQYFEWQRDIQNKHCPLLHQFYKRTAPLVRQLTPDEQQLCDMSGVARECFCLIQELEDSMDRTKRVTLRTYAYFHNVSNVIRGVASFAGCYARYNWKITTTRWREYLKEFFGSQDKFESFSLSYQESSLFQAFEEDIQLLQREIALFIQTKFATAFDVYLLNYEANQKIYEELPQIVRESFQGHSEVIQEFFAEVKKKLDLIRRRFLEHRYNRIYADEELFLISAVVEELVTPVVFLVMILRDSDTLFGGEVPQSELMEDLFPKELIALMRLTEHTPQEQMPSFSPPKVEEVFEEKEEALPTSLASEEPVKEVTRVERRAPEVEPKVQTKFSYTEAKEIFDFSRLTLLQRKELSSKYYDPERDQTIEVFGFEEGASVSFVHKIPLLKFREVFGRYFPDMDKNVKAEDVRRVLDSDERFHFDHMTASHAIYKICETEESFPVPKGNNEGVLASGTLKSIRYSMGRALIASITKELEEGDLSDEKREELTLELASLQSQLE